MSINTSDQSSKCKNDALAKEETSYSKEEVKGNCLEYFKGDSLATSVVMNKYLLKNDHDDFLEKDPDDMLKNRITKEFARIEKSYPNSITEEEIYEAFKEFKYIVPQGSPLFGIGNKEQIVSIGNCFVVGQPTDSYGGILQKDQQLAQIMKRRGGVGMDISTIRPTGMKVRNSARTSDGIGCFMQRFSNTTKEVAQNGRRGALMISIDSRHPDLDTFIQIKRDKTKVTGANISIKWHDDVLEAVKNDEEYTLRFPVDASIEDAQMTKVVKIKELWDKFVESNWEGAEPGCFFWDTITSQSISDCYGDVGFKTVTSNPCIKGDTLIAVADGRNAVSIKQLADEGKDVPVYSTDIKTGQRQIKMGRNPRMTKQNTEVWKLILDDGSELIATPDHKILTKNMEYVELKDLKPGMSLNPFNSFDNNNYRQITNVGQLMSSSKLHRNRRQYRLISEFNGVTVDPKEYAIHHKDFNSKNDCFENLEVMPQKDHHRLHSDLMKGENNPMNRFPEKNWLIKQDWSGSNNGRFSGYTNEEIIEFGKKVFNLHGKITKTIWVDEAKKEGYPQHLSNEFRFGTWDNFKNQVATNHKVKSVEFYGYEDVYNITVDDNHNYDVITSYEDGKFITSSGITVKNCGEILMSAYNSCILMLVNLKSFVDNPFTNKAKFNYKRFEKYMRIATRLIDDMIDLEIQKVDQIIAKIKSDPEGKDIKAEELKLWNYIKYYYEQGRRTGLGVTALGDMLAALGIQYSSEEALKMTDRVFKKFHFYTYDENAELAKERGSFPAWSWEKEKDSHYIKILPKETQEKIKKYGRRNIASNTCAPAGSVSMMTQTTSGVEPLFMRSYVRNRKMTNEEINLGMKEAYTDSDGIKWTSYDVYHHGLKEWSDLNPGVPVEESPYKDSEAGELDWRFRVKLQGIVQRYIDHSISSTINLSKDVSKEEVNDVYMLAHQYKCKGITIYREGSRLGVLTSATEKNIDEKKIEDNNAPKRENMLPCEIHYSNIKNLETKEVDSWIFMVGVLDGRPYEIFGGKRTSIEISKKHKEGWIVKNGKNDQGVRTYDLYLGSLDDTPERMIVEDIANEFSTSSSSYTRIISTMLRHGVPIKTICEQLHKDSASDMWTFEKAVSRTIKKYIKDGESASGACPSCGHGELQYRDGCVICPECGDGRCG